MRSFASGEGGWGLFKVTVTDGVMDVVYVKCKVRCRTDVGGRDLERPRKSSDTSRQDGSRREAQRRTPSSSSSPTRAFDCFPSLILFLHDTLLHPCFVPRNLVVCATRSLGCFAVQPLDEGHPKRSARHHHVFSVAPPRPLRRSDGTGLHRASLLHASSYGLSGPVCLF
jgi:hypothetical protein